MSEETTRPPNHRGAIVKSSLHIMEFSQADIHSKINFATVALYPDDLKTIENVIIQTLKQIDQKQ